jgi:threonine dehydrogenase-like Zn-dependent dehydrogenase
MSPEPAGSAPRVPARTSSGGRGEAVGAVELYRSVPRYIAARALSGRLPSVAAGSAAPLRLVSRRAVEPTSGWARVRPRLTGICGSDLATVTGRSSFYFSSLISMPFVPGHEIVGDLVDDVDTPRGPLTAGTRVVLAPVLNCAARGVTPCAGCSADRPTRCDNVTSGHLAPGLQTGYCADTGGGWSSELRAHGSQLFAVPEGVPDEVAVLVEPLAGAVHAARRAEVLPGERVLVIGAGAIGLLTLLALRALTPASEVLVAAKHAKQKDLARRFGADQVLPSGTGTGGLIGAVRRSTRAMQLTPERGAPYLLGGVDVTLECAGGALDTALRVTRAGGRVVLSGLPTSSPDLTPLWFRELSLVGAYAAGPSDFAAALDLVADATTAALLREVLGATYPLTRWRDALDHALAAGRLGTGRVAFTLGADPAAGPTVGKNGSARSKGTSP